MEEPETHEKAMASDQAQEWAEAMKQEMDSLIQHQTWELIPKTEVKPGYRPLKGKWVYKIKRGVNNQITCFKARWVAKGYLQQAGIDFDQTFVAVVKPMAFRALFAIAAFYNLDIEQMDVKTEFLHGIIDQLLYVEVPRGYEQEWKDQICRLRRALYGLKQSPRLWYERLSNFLLTKLGLHRLHADHSIFVTPQGVQGPIVTTFVDDLNIFTPAGSGIMKRVKEELAAAFDIVDMGPLAFYVGLKVTRDRERKTIKLSQPGYIEKLFDRHGMLKAKTVKIPMRETPLLPYEKPVTSIKKTKYAAKIGSIMYEMVETRIDIAFATSMVSRFTKNPGPDHFSAVDQILRYLAGSQDRGITFGGESELRLVGYSDSDWAGDHADRKSTSGFVFTLNGGPISYGSKKQAVVALSSTEAEYVALSLAAREATWLRLLLTELGLLQPDQQFAEIRAHESNKCVDAISRPDIQYERPDSGGDIAQQQKRAEISDLSDTVQPPPVPITLKGDNQSSIALSNNPILHTRTKHIDIQHHYIRDEVTSGRINLVYTPTELMLADGLTKPLSSVKFLNFIREMHME